MLVNQSGRSRSEGFLATSIRMCICTESVKESLPDQKGLCRGQIPGALENGGSLFLDTLYRPLTKIEDVGIEIPGAGGWWNSGNAIDLKRKCNRLKKQSISNNAIFMGQRVDFKSSIEAI